MTEPMIETLWVLQADIDDESPQILGSLIEKALINGALDAHYTALLMKKNRPGHRFELLSKPEDKDRFIRFLLTETTTLGVKAKEIERHALERRFSCIDIHQRQINVKLALLDGKVLRAQPEFEDCKKLAEELGVPVREILEEAKAVARDRFLNGE